ncbi:TRAM domain-containing protein [Candidatus Woesearchaeota archaeon]|nr:TRAM domain-containing protein [Candidatus Woesearchaeota archaeon]
MYGNRFQRFAPINVGDEIDVKIEAIGEKGDGIAKVEGFVLIVPNTSKGDQVRVKVTKVLRRVGFGEVIGESEAEEEIVEEEEEAGEEEEIEDTEDFGADLDE